jgi:hypothetical protein
MERGQEEGNFTQKQQAWEYKIFSPKNLQYHYIDITNKNICSHWMEVFIFVNLRVI